MARKFLKNLKLFVSALLIIAICFWALSEYKKEEPENDDTPSSPNAKSMSVIYMDVGQGDSSFITLPDGKTILIDAANPGDGQDIVDYLKNMNVNHLDYVIATHPHADHIGGMRYVIENMSIGKIFASKIANSDIPTTKSYENFLLSVKDKGLKITTARGGMVLFEGDGYKAECFAPNMDKNDGINNYSIVFSLTYKDDSFLFTGDAEKEIEEEILYKGYNIDCDVLKVGHHGSSSSSTKRFLEKVSPEYAVISCGRDNSYGHPHGETLSAFDNLRDFTKLYRTDVEGTIIATSKGDGKITFKTGEKSVVTGD